MRTLALPLVAVLLVVVLGLLGVLYVFVAPNAHWNGSNPDAEDADRRMDAVRQASAIGLPGAVNVTEASPRGIVSATLPPEVFGERGRAGPLVSNVSIWRRAFDWTGVDLQGFAGGPAGALLAQVELHDVALAAVGLFPLRGAGSSLGEAGRSRIRVHVAGQQSAGRSQEYYFDLAAPRLVHYRIYRGSGSGAALFVRLEYDQAARRLEVESYYSDTTFLDREYSRNPTKGTVNVE